MARLIAYSDYRLTEQPQPMMIVTNDSWGPDIGSQSVNKSGAKKLRFQRAAESVPEHCCAPDFVFEVVTHG